MAEEKIAEKKAKKNNRVAVRLNKRYGAVNPGEVAGYAPEVAKRLVAEGHAEFAK